MKGIFTERNIVVVLFVMVLVTFSMAQNETKRIEQLYNGGHTSWRKFPGLRPEAKSTVPSAHDARLAKSSL